MDQSAKNRVLKLGKYLKYVRSKRGYSLRKVQHRCGIGSGYISELENSKTHSMPTISIINKLAKGLRISPVYMYKIVGVKSVPKFKSNTIDLRKAIDNFVKITWGGRPLNITDILALKLWFEHHN